MSAPETTRPATARVRLARIAERVVDADEGVGAAAAGGRRLTRDGERTIPGIVAAETAGGAVDLELYLVVAAPTMPLWRTADALREAIVAEAARAGLAGRLGAIDVAFEDLAAPATSEAPR